jgi:hypothetical protein
MRNKLSVYATSSIKTLIVLSCMIVVIVSLTSFESQSIVGKWNQVSSRQFLTPEGVKTYGKPVLETPTATMGNVVIEFRSDNTYVMKSSRINDTKVLTFTGTWSLSGNKLEMKLDPKQEDPKYNPKKDDVSPNTTVSINGNSMIMSTLYPDRKIINKIELTLTRM